MVTTVNKSDAKKLAKIATFSEKSNSLERLQITSAATTIEGKGLNAALKNFLTVGEKYLTDAQKTLLTFTAVKNAISKHETLKNKTLFSYFDLQLTCQRIIKEQDKNTQRAERAAKQAAKTAKK
jgi:CMP-N-acetylneuraminic acid synthetase